MQSQAPAPGPVCAREPGCTGRVADGLVPDGSAGRPEAGFGWLVLPRHGRRPLAVLGRRLMQAGNRCAGLDAWSELAIHETAAGRIALALCHVCHPADGPPWRDAWLCEDAAAARASLLAHDPLQGLPCDQLRRGLRVAGFEAAWQGLLAAVVGRDAA